MPDMQFINTLTESKLFRTESMLTQLYIKDVADCLFMNCVLLTIFKNIYETSGFTFEYVKKTQQFSNFNVFRGNYNDLCMLLYAFNNESILPKMVKTKNDEILLSKVRLNMRDMQQWLRDIYRGVDTIGRDRRFLLAIQDQLQIDNSIYKVLRRQASEWRNIDFEAQKLVATRLLHVFQTKFRRSELLPVLMGIIEIYNLKIDEAENPEETTKRKNEIMHKYLSTIGYGSAVDKPRGFMKDMKSLVEDASSTSSNSIATVVQPFMTEKPTKKKKSKIIKR